MPPKLNCEPIEAPAGHKLAKKIHILLCDYNSLHTKEVNKHQNIF